MGWKLQLFLVGSAVVVGLYLTGFFSPEPLSLDPGEGWWAREEKGTVKVNTSIRPFKVEFSKEAQEDLKRRLQNTRYFESLEGTYWEYGIRADVMRNIVDYWLNNYSWEKQERVFNQYNHFKTNIEGIDVHFVHVKPKVIEGQKVKPILMVHGWPGSFHNFYKITPMLTDPASHGGTEDDVFEVICPSLPGYGFSEAAHRPGLDPRQIARMFNTLMHERLGFETYYVQGGDFGALVIEQMALFFPESIRGHHSNFLVITPPLLPLRLLIGHLFPEWYYPWIEDRRIFTPVNEMLSFFLEETGYSHIQATKPDTIGHGLTDSPVGLAAYILEKFPHPNDVKYRDGKLTEKFEMNDLLNNIMVYWISGCITSTLRYYKELAASFTETVEFASVLISVPTGYAAFPDEGLRSPEHWMPFRYANIISYTAMPRGGHWASLEEPLLLAEDIRQFSRGVEAFWLGKSTEKTKDTPP